MRRTGFTLLEALVALVILGLVATASLQLFGSALRSARAAEAWSVAAAYAEEGMEMAKLDLASAVARGDEALEGGFARRTRVTPVTGGTSRVTVTITFPGGGVFELDRLVGAP